MGRPRKLTAEDYLAKRDAKMKAYYERNKEKLKQYRRDLYQKQKEEIKIKRKKKKENNK